MAGAAVVWFRNDLRLDDNPALHAATEMGGPIIPLYIQSTDESDKWASGAASRWWLHHSLQALDDSLRKQKSQLILRRGKTLETLWEVARATGARTILWNRRYEPAHIEQDRAVKRALQEEGLQVESFNGALLFEPWEVLTQRNEPYQVYTPFSKACLQHEPPAEPLDRPKSLPVPKKWCQSVALDSLELLPKIDWAAGIDAAWTPGEAGAEKRADVFLKDHVNDYGEERDRPDLSSTSRLSPHLHFGEISPRRLWKTLHGKPGKVSAGAKVFRSELLWREFGYHLLYHFPETPDQSMREKFRDFPWQEDLAMLRAWQRGKTGYPLVDAGMRELWRTGWMHNRVRMVVASFLVKHLLLPWQRGAEWFWDTLVDADLANNTLNWQWSAGCGADAAPYFRIFNPVLQGEKYDPDGNYVAEHVPELSKLPAKWIHKPWEAPSDVLKEAQVELGKTYPHPIVDHAEARQRALDAYQAVK